MADRSAIEWTDSTWNPLRARNQATGGVGHFCEHASEGCRNCYAERFQPRVNNPIRFARQDRDHGEHGPATATPASLPPGAPP